MAEKFVKAGSIEVALAQKCENAAYLAGGTEINRLGSTVHADTLISIRDIGNLKGIYGKEDIVVIGSGTTFQEAVECDIVPDYFKEACMMMASRTKRNMATIGGNIALLRDDSYIVPCLIAAKATILYMDKDMIQHSGCICCYMEDKKKGELKDALILAIALPINRRVINKRYANTAMSHSMMNISYGCEADGSEVSIGAAVKNVGLTKLIDFEELIAGRSDISEEEIMNWAKAYTGFAFEKDIYGGVEYKRYILGTTLAKMVSDAGKEA